MAVSSRIVGGAPMTAKVDPPGAAGDEERQPVIVLVSGHTPTRRLIVAELTKRYGADYQIRVGKDSASVQRILVDLASSGEDVALVLAALGPTDPEGIDMHAPVRRLFPTALRVVAVRWGGW